MSTIAVSDLRRRAQVEDGTSNAPSVSFSNDLNTGIYRVAEDTLGIATGGIERMRIGTTSGSLQVSASNTPLAKFAIPYIKSYPPAAMTASMTQITSSTYGKGIYVSSASTEYTSSAWYSWKAFDKNASTYWQIASSTYTNGVAYTGPFHTVDTAGTVYRGEWIQLQLPISIVLSSYTLASENGFNTPSGFHLLGSLNGYEWTLLDTETGITTGWASPQTFSVSTNQAYTHFRLVIHTAINTMPVLYEFSLQGTEECLSVTENAMTGIGVTAPAQMLEVGGPMILHGPLSATNMGSFRNRIINGDMRIAQRATSSSTQNAYVLDRWKLNAAITTGVMTVSRQALVSTDTPYQYGFRNYMSLVATTACTSFSYIEPVQIIEGTHVADFMWGTPFAQPATLSLWMKTNAPAGSLFSVAIRNNNQSPVYSATFTSASVSGMWKYVQVTIPPPPSAPSTWISDHTGGWEVFLCPIGNYGAANPVNTWSLNTSTNFAGKYNWPSVLNNYVYITGVQFEKGTLATPFEFRPFPTELQLCQRYYYTHEYSYKLYAADYAHTIYPLPIQMRISPTVTKIVTAGTGVAISVVQDTVSKNQLVQFYNSLIGPGTRGENGIVYFDAEL